MDATCWGNRRGYGRHLRSLLTALCEIEHRNEYVLFADGAFEFPSSSLVAEVVRVPAGVPAAMAARAGGRRSLADLWAMSRVLSRAEVDLLVFPTVYSYVPVLTRARKLLMIHDVIAERLPRHIFPKGKGRLWWALKSRLARMQADRIVTVSDFSRRLLAEQFTLPQEKIGVVGEAPDSVFQPLADAGFPLSLSNQGISAVQRIVTYVGGFGPHKNLLRLADAFEALAADARFADVVLVLVGDYAGDPFHSTYSELNERLRESSIASRVVLTGYLPDAALVQVLNASSLFVLPSLMEGFGLPAVEAAACGVPVVATKHSPLPELLGGGILSIDPESVEDLRHALARLLEDENLRSRMGREALQAARCLSWRSAALELRELLEETVNEAPLHYEQTA